jgi:hypothetical protein
MSWRRTKSSLAPVYLVRPHSVAPQRQLKLQNHPSDSTSHSHTSPNCHKSSDTHSNSGETICSGASKDCTAKASLTCHEMWQCINQAPGLFDSNTIANQPPAGRVAVSRRGGVAKLRFPKFESGENVPEPWPRTKKSCT